MGKALRFSVVTIVALAAYIAVAEKPEFTYVPPKQEWAPPPGFEKTERPWAPPPGFPAPPKPWAPPKGWGAPSQWAPPEEFKGKIIRQELPAPPP